MKPLNIAGVEMYNGIATLENRNFLKKLNKD